MRLAIFLTLITSQFLAAQTLEQTLKFGLEQYQNKNYSTALESFKRVLFFDQNNQFGPQIYTQMAESLYATKAYQEAAYYYDLAYFSNPVDVQADLILKRVSCFLLLKQHGQAEIELLNLPEQLSDSQKELQLFYEALLAFAIADFPKSERHFKEIAQDTMAIHTLFRKNDAISKLSPRKARIMSMILPGLGQIYAGDIKNGINSFVLTGGLFYLGLRSAMNTSLIDAGLSTIPWFQRYYMGGYKKAEQIAEAKIKERRHKVFNRLLEQVED